MAIHTKKRDRVNMMTPSSISTATTSSACSSSSNQEDEYERAVAFLREFHTQRVVAQATFLHSTSLDDILEADHFDEMLASDFSLALSVGQRRSSSSDAFLSSDNKTMMKRNKESCLQSQQQQRRTTSRLRRNPSSSFPRMKKTTTSKCLLDLDDSISSSSNNLNERSSLESTTLRTVSPAPESSIDTDYYFGYDDEISLPMAKRHRSSLS